MNFDVRFENVTLKYQNTEVLKDIYLTINYGKIYGLLGKNGAGKTTLLSLLASFLSPSTGSVTVGDKNVYENEKIIPYIYFGNNFYYKNELVADYFKFNNSFRPNFDLDYANDLASIFKLPLNKPIYDLSMGKISALNATVGLASGSPITIFDEAYIGMDFFTRDLFYQEILKEQKRCQRTFILSTHIVSEMEYLFDHVLILDNGRIVIDDDYNQVISMGAKVTGGYKQVDKFVNDKKKLSDKQLGGIKSVMILDNIEQLEGAKGPYKGLEISPVSLHELFSNLTREDQSL
ncbi:ABC transporter ATP-binding protein [Proteinivorax tanatarense]|uniref:ABC transporter ATP-binding protein n=1 Tax=Proteinivorax tanatarense TaxID=1260629 RepID=A0AAU7VK33_9FIRM